MRRFSIVISFLAACASGGPPGSEGTGQASAATSNDATSVRNGRTGGPLLVSAFLPPTGYVSAAYQYATLVSGGAAPINIDLAGLPPGLAYDPTTGLIAGTPSAAGSYSVTRTVRDANDAGEISQSTLTILDSASFVPSSLSLKECVVPHDTERQVSASASAIDYGAPGTPKHCVRDVAFVHDTYRDLLKQSATAPRFVFDFAGESSLAYSVYVGPTEFAKGSLDKTSTGFELILSEESLGKPFTSWSDSALVTVHVGNELQSLDVVLSIGFLPTPLFVREAPELVHAGFTNFGYTEDSIDAIFAATGERVFIASGQELRNVSGSPVVVSLSADPSVFEASFDRSVTTAFLTGAGGTTLEAGAIYMTDNCPADRVYYRPPSYAPSPCFYTPQGTCPFAMSAARAYVCAPQTAFDPFNVKPAAAAAYQFDEFPIQTYEMSQHQAPPEQSSEQVALVGVFSNLSATIPAAFADGENSALLGTTARLLVLAPGQSVWLGFGITRPAMRTLPAREISYGNGVGGVINYTDRMTCTRPEIFDRVPGNFNLGIPTKMVPRRRIDAETHFRLSLTGNATGEIVGAKTARPLFGTSLHRAFDYNAEATHSFDARTFTLPTHVCP